MFTGTHRTEETHVFAFRLDTEPGDRLVKVFSVTASDLHGVVLE